MGVVIKSKSYGILQSAGVPQGKIDALASKNIKLSLSHQEVEFYSNANVLLAKASLPCPAKLVLDGAATATQMSLAAGALTLAAEKAIGYLAGGTPASINTASGSKWAPAAKIDPATVLAPEVAAAKAPVPLRDATTLYQRVQGTSEGSVYVAVAISKNVKVAARFKGGSKVSMRVEGVLSPAVKMAFEAVGFGFKGGDYGSAHYGLESGNEASRVIGAVLMGCGVEFDTPLPKMQHVKELSS